MDNEVGQHLLDIKETLGRVDGRLAGLEKAVLGDGQPGLAQKVEDLQAAKNWTWGGGAVLTFLAGLAEYLFHRGR
jgi:hypothetical protein